MPDLVPYHKLSEIDLDQIIERIASGEYQSAIAKELGCTPAALSRKLRNIPEATIARELGMETRLDQGLETMEDCMSRLSVAAEQCNVNLARVTLDKLKGADAVLRRLEWRASVEAPHRWSSTQRIEQHVKHSYSTVLRSIDEIQSEQVQEKEVDSSEDGAG